MPVHDWTRVDAGIFHDFHTVWIGAIRSSLNGGLLPKGYYALAEQHAGQTIADVLTLHSGSEATGNSSPSPNGGTRVAEAPPRVRRHQSAKLPGLLRPRTIAIRHISEHQLVAVIEILSPGNKDRAAHVDTFAGKAADALEQGIHLLVVDILPPGRFDPHGIHARIWQEVAHTGESYELPANEPLTLASYAAGAPTEAYIEHLAVGAPLPQMPLFLQHDRYINVPLEQTYQEAYRGVPSVWREVIETPAAPKQGR